MGRRIVPAIAVAFLTLWTASSGEAQSPPGIPPSPADGSFVDDRAGVLGQEAVRELGMVQEHAFEEHQTPIVVVTIPSRAEYGAGDESIERFAARWFDRWEIGKEGDEGLVNRGVLVLVSVQDREARIELGAEWGREWDDHAAEIMDERMVPAFRRGDFAEGAVEGAWALLGMAERGPDGVAPSRPGRVLPSLGSSPLETTPVPIWGSLLLFLAGAGLLSAAARHPTKRTNLVLGGLVLLVGSIVFWVLLGAIAVVGARFFDLGDGGRGTGGGFGSSGGFGSGGFSGGGGATGRW